MKKSPFRDYMICFRDSAGKIQFTQVYSQHTLEQIVKEFKKSEIFGRMTILGSCDLDHVSYVKFDAEPKFTCM